MAKDVEQQLKIENIHQLLTEAMDVVFDSIFLISADTANFIYVNQAASTKLEYATEEMIGGMSVFDIDPDFPSLDIWQKHLCDLKVLKSLQLETRHKSKSGYCYPVELTVTLFQQLGQDVILAIARDISERKACEENIIFREQELRALAESSPGVMGSLVMQDGNLAATYVSQNALDLFGIFPNKMINNFQTFQQLIYPRDVRKVYKSLENAAKNLNEWCGEFRIVHPNKGLRWLEVKSKPQPYPQGGVIFYGHVYDITDRKDTEDSLRLSLDFNEGIISTIPDLLLEIDHDGTYLEVWTKNEALLIAQRDELIGKKFQDILPPPAAEVARQTMKEANDQGFSVGNIYSLDLPDGTHWFELYMTKKKAANTYITLARDITEKKESESILSTLARALDISSESIFLIKLDTGKFVYVNDRACQKLGYSKKELLDGMAVVDIDPNMADGLWSEHVQKTRENGSGGASIKSHHKTKTGNVYPVEVLSHYFEFKGEEFSFAITHEIKSSDS